MGNTMKTEEKLKKIINEMPDPRLAMFVISCHVDRPLEEKIPVSIYDIPIQAGATLTEERVCEITDSDPGEEKQEESGMPYPDISERNQRYSEMTAMYWIGRHLMTDYVGISHYRRRFQISDEALANYMSSGFDIITTVKYQLPETIAEKYRKTHYSYDWNLFLDILCRRNPEYRELAGEIFNNRQMHLCNMNIFRKEIYEEYCNFVFPILDEFYRKSAWKMDTYQRRDVGFIGERLSSLFIEKKKRDGYTVYEEPFRNYRSREWTPQEECDLNDFETVYSRCAYYYEKQNLERCRGLTGEAIKHGAIKDVKLCELAEIFYAASEEQHRFRETLFEYLPPQWKQNLDILREGYRAVGTMVKLIAQNPTPEVVQMFHEFLQATGFSEEVIRLQCKKQGMEDAEKVLSYAPVRKQL